MSFLTKTTDEIVGVIDEKHGDGDVVFLGHFGEEFPSNRDRIRRKESGMEDSVRFWIDSNVIRAFASSWL